MVSAYVNCTHVRVPVANLAKYRWLPLADPLHTNIPANSSSVPVGKAVLLVICITPSTPVLAVDPDAKKLGAKAVSALVVVTLFPASMLEW